MFGIPDFGISSAYVLCILSGLACVVYGITHWNKGNEDEPEQIQEEEVWEQSQHEIDEKL